MTSAKENIAELQTNKSGSEDRRVMLHSVNAELFEATTKLFWYSIEMYTKINFIEWVKGENENGLLGLADKLGELGEFIKMNREELKKGNYDILDITNSWTVIDNYVRDQAFRAANDVLGKMISSEKQKVKKLKEEIDCRRQELSKDGGCWSDEDKKREEEYKAAEKHLENLGKTKNKLDRQNEDERRCQDRLRNSRNKAFAHCIVVEKDISKVGSWVLQNKALYTWASDIIEYLQVINRRYVIYEKFDESYNLVNGTNRVKNEFDACRTFIEQQIATLDQFGDSNIALEFSDNLCDEEQIENRKKQIEDGKKQIQDWAAKWDRISYLATGDSENVKNTLRQYSEIDAGPYLFDLQEAFGEESKENADYAYFILLYHLNPTMEKIYWRGKSYSKEEFAEQVILKIITSRKERGLIDNLYTYISQQGIELIKWSNKHLLSVYFHCIGDETGKRMAEEMEEAILAFHDAVEFADNEEFHEVIRTAAQLYFHMYKCEFVYTRTKYKGGKLSWKSWEEACECIKTDESFKSYADICEIVDYLCGSYYFKLWMEKIQSPRYKEYIQLFKPRDDAHLEKNRQKILKKVKTFYEIMGADPFKNKWIKQEDTELMITAKS